MRILLTILCLLAMPAVALAQPPAAPVPPPELHSNLTQHYVVWEAYCPTETGVEKCWIYIVRRRESSDISRLDYNGDGCVGMAEFTALGQLWGQCEETLE